MLIDGTDYKINVLILFMERETDVTIQTVETLLESLEDGVIISVLLNGGSNQEVEKLFSGVDSIRYYESPDNLGVAGGRNFLFQTSECSDSDIVFILDNDVVPPLDYLRNLATFLVRQPDAGVVGAATADIKKLAYDFLRFYGDFGKFGNKIFKLESRDIKKYIVRDTDPENLFHIGIHPDYIYSYTSIRPLYYQFFRKLFFMINIKTSFEPMLKNNSRYLDYIQDGVEKYDVSNLAGCSQAFRRELLDKIGHLNNLFNPYGFEDSDFNVRSIRAGFKNYIDTNTWLFHGTDARHENRKKDPFEAYESHFRNLTFLTYFILSSFEKCRRSMLKRIIMSFPIEFAYQGFSSLKSLRAKMRGYKKAMKALEENSGGS